MIEYAEYCIKNMKSFYIVCGGLLLLLLTHITSFAQSCSASVGSGTVLWSSLSWSCSGGGTAPVTSGAVYNQNLTLNNLGNGDNLVIDVGMTINGNITINASGSNPTITVNNNISFRVTGSINNPNNNVRYIVNSGSVLRVDGTLQGNNNIRFGGTGTVRGGSLSLGNNADCLTPCPTIGFTNCTSGSTGGVPNYFCNQFNNAMLPIALSEFVAQEKEQQVKLYWKTATERNNAYFAVEHSYDSRNWTKITTIEGAGNSNTPKEYTYLHSLPTVGINYYRLKQTDTNKDYTYSPVASVEIKSSQELVVFPNPSQDGIFWIRPHTSTKQASLKVYDVVGKLILQQRFESFQDAIAKIDLSGQSNGIYMLVWQDQYSTQRKKIAFAK